MNEQDADWRVCPWCPEDDCLWPPDAFGASGTAYAYNPPCNACWAARHPMKRTPCGGCGQAVKTRGRRRPAFHRACEVAA